MVKGHGADTDGEETFVPDGVTVRFYSAETVNLVTDVALFAMLDQAGDPGLPISGGPIKNYTLYKQDDQFIAQWLAMAGDSVAKIWWVGTDIPDETRLCTDPNRNSDDPEAVTCRGLGQHTCTGVLGLVQDTDIAIVACRGSWVEASTGAAVATSYDSQVATVDKLVADILADLQSGDGAKVADAEKKVDGLPQEQIAVMIVTKSFADWQRARWLKEYALQNNLEQLIGQLTSNKDKLDPMMEWLDTIPSYGQALDKLATTYRETFYQWFNTGSDEVKAALRSRPAIDKVVDEQIHDERTTAGVRQMMDPEGAEQEEAETLGAAQRMFEEGQSR
jgi:hypothetical protein